MQECAECGATIEDDNGYLCHLCRSMPMFEVYADPEPEIYMEEPCDHEFKELNNGMAQCIYCGVIED